MKIPQIVLGNLWMLLYNNDHLWGFSFPRKCYVKMNVYNLYSIRLNSRAAQLTLFLYSLAIFFSYALQFYVLMEILGKNVIAPRVPERWFNTADFLTRILLNIITGEKHLTYHVTRD